MKILMLKNTVVKLQFRNVAQRNW